MLVTSTRFLGFLSLLICGWLVLYWQGVVAMEEIWRRSDTFAHGYFILPISLWLIYRDRAFLKSAVAAPTAIALLPLFGSCFIWLFAYAADINVLLQLATVFSLISILWMCLGHQLTWRYKFPLAYLLFAVPMGENLIPLLQDVTAWITVFLLKVHGIPVFRDGLYIQIPNGLFEVAVACSGIRYLIASMAVGTLFAYLSYSSFKKQIIFIVFSFVLPIIANGIRAYLIVIIAHYSDMKYATGADHLVYGWIFFGFVIMLMFWVGGKFVDSEANKATFTSNEAGKHFNSKVLPTGLIAGLFLIGTWSIQHNLPVIQAPEEPQIDIAGLKNVESSNWGINFEQPVRKAHVKLEQGEEIFYAKYGNKQNSGELVNHANKLYNHDAWTVVERVTFELESRKVRFLLLRNTAGRERGVIYWYKVGDLTFVNSAFTKLYQAFSLLSGQADVAEVFAFSTEQFDGAEPIEKLKSIARTGQLQLEAIR
ncbi:exosortase A [Thalassotalea sp. M1531]|uniref:Exosortase A n=1 Tax=Thalassotalea algicola TaxID=2716224 RepID=A0A7Y0Q8B8_9GAMM|nr:exosortase A [Thalassotalea algicola]NMP33066.1 exosortase A [Thalassotalea algicola]